MVEDSGLYTCRAVNSKGEAMSTTTLKVQGKIENLILPPLRLEALLRILSIVRVKG